MKLRKLISATIVAMLVSGCASEAELRMAYDAQVEIATAQANSAAVQQSTLSINCTTGCEGLSVNYIDPRDRNKSVVPRVSNTNDVIIGTAPAALSAVKWIGGFWAGTEIVDSIMDGTSGSITANTQSVSGESNVLQSDRNQVDINDIHINRHLEENINE